MKSFGIKRDEKDPRWFELFMPWLRDKTDINALGSIFDYYGIMNNDLNHIYKSSGSDVKSYFDRIITLDEWEAEFMQPQLAGREYDEKLIHDWCKFKNNALIGITEFMQNRYAKQDRISEIKEQIEKLSEELKELEK